LTNSDVYRIESRARFESWLNLTDYISCFQPHLGKPQHTDVPSIMIFQNPVKKLSICQTLKLGLFCELNYSRSLDRQGGEWWVWISMVIFRTRVWYM